MSDNKEWEERYKKQIVHHAVEISAQGIFVLRDFIAAELSRVREETLKEVEGIVESITKTRFNGEGLPFENSPEIYGNKRIEAYKKGFNESLTALQAKLQKLRRQ